tara:strand:- start:707 stop:1696 length:990 start_codon:yes stop_codon:yes gene_type:complete
MNRERDVGFNIPGTLSKCHPCRVIMRHRRVGFAPSRIDRGGVSHVIAGTQGELLILDSKGNPRGGVSTPFPAPTIDGLVLKDRWIGIWLDREFRQARMAALPIDEIWGDGVTREELRLSIGSPEGYVVPSNSIWHRVLDSEPMKMGAFEDNIVFATLSGIYMIDSEANEIWRSPIPRWPAISKISQYDNLISINEFSGGLAVWSQAGGVSVLDPSNGVEIYNRVLEFGDKVCSVIYSKEAGWLVILHGGTVAVMDKIEGGHSIHKTKGPVMDSEFVDGRWAWTGWRHDGDLAEGKVRSRRRRNIGVALLGGMVLSNDGTWSDWASLTRT